MHVVMRLKRGDASVHRYVKLTRLTDEGGVVFNAWRSEFEDERCDS